MIAEKAGKTEMSYLFVAPPWNRKVVDSAESLWRHFMAYTLQSDDSPLLEQKAFSTKSGVVYADINKLRPYSIDAFLNFMGMPKSTWTKMRREETEVMMLETMELIDSVIADQMFQGAAADMLNANIISRRLGLVEKTEIVGKQEKSLPDDDRNNAIHVHPDDPDPLGENRPLYSLAQLESGFPFRDNPQTIDASEF
jgi:hypothetical protein